MDRLWLDYETRSVLSLDERGLDNYAHDPSTQILLAAYAFDDKAPKLWQPHLDPKIPEELEEALRSPWAEAWAWNAQFERVITRRVLGIDKPIEEFRDPMANARYLSLPGSLDGAGEILGLGEGQAKLKDGKRLIKLFCEPESLGGDSTLFGVSEPTFRDWRTDPADWKLFGEYCVQDVIAERALAKKMRKFALSEEEWQTWILSEHINERGIPVDAALVAGARAIVDKETARLVAQLKEITGLDNPNSTSQFLEWLRGNGYSFTSIGKEFVARALSGECDLTDSAKTALSLRGQTSKSSVKKYTAIADTVGSDGRLRYAYQYMGASRTGRFSSLGANLANLAKAAKAVEKNMDRAIELVQNQDYDSILAEFGKPLDVAASVVRSSFRAPEDSRFTVCDSGAIENRVLGWVARCNGILDVFRKVFTYHGPDAVEYGTKKPIKDGMQYPWDPYLDFATRLYNQSYHDLWIEWKIKGDATKRNNSKPPVLGAGFQLGPGREEIDKETGVLTWTGLLGYARALGVEMTLEEAQYAIRVFREAYTEVVWYWKDIHRAAVHAIRNPGHLTGVGVPQTQRDQEYFEKLNRTVYDPRISFLCHSTKVLEMKLPSNRSLHYIQPQVRVEDANWEGRDYKRDMIYYQGKELGSQTWGECVASPGRLTENSVQAIARDILVHGMKLADRRGFPIVLHTYDEIGSVVTSKSQLGLPQLVECMTDSPPFAPDLPLSADGYESIYYKK